MTVYVDDARARVGRLIMCHMVSDSESELHAMADRIGVARRWFHRGHYNVCLAKRNLAAAFGAVETTQRHAARVRRSLETKTAPLGAPAGPLRR